MEKIEIKTLIDITNTRVNRSGQGNQIQIDQQRNFITLIQCAEIKSIIEYTSSPILEEIELKKLGFGTEYKGKHRVWTFRFQTDRSGVYKDDEGNHIGLLLEDLHEVPIIKNLSETINIVKPIFDCKDQITKNTLVTLLGE